MTHSSNCTTTTFPRLYAIADASFGNPVELAGALFAGGASLVQIRFKRSGAGDFLEQVEATLRIAPPGTRILVNDRVDIAKLAGAAGVHLGQEDLPVEAARRILGSGALIGLSTHNFEQALRSEELPLDYIAVGPIFATATKENADPVLGLEKLREISAKVRLPVVAVGGITLENAPQVLQAGAASVAVISALLKARDVAAETRRWVETL
jgi:thiamine-phosphate pyrophosphorylase